MSDGIKVDRGTGILVWFADGRQKYMLFNEQATMMAQIERLKEKIPPDRIWCGIISWNDESLVTFDEAEVNDLNGPKN
jgi:hypothetical protein